MLAAPIPHLFEQTVKLRVGCPLERTLERAVLN
jgi:hypothetical protein